MRTTVTIDDALLAKAKAFTGIKQTPALVRAAIEALVQREVARRIILLEGTEPDLKLPPRRRPDPVRDIDGEDDDGAGRE
jgi:Arc/MetJ family transcription regulator